MCQSFYIITIIYTSMCVFYMVNAMYLYYLSTQPIYLYLSISIYLYLSIYSSIYLLLNHSISIIIITSSLLYHLNYRLQTDKSLLTTTIASSLYLFRLLLCDISRLEFQKVYQALGGLYCTTLIDLF